MSKENKCKGSKAWLWGAAIGTVVGSVTALLFAPKAGRELRKDIADGARQVGEKTQEVAGKVSEKTQEVASKVSEKTQEVAGKVSEQSVQLAGKVKDSAGELVNDFKNWRAAKQADEDHLQISSVEDADDSADEETAVIGVADESVEADADSEAAAGEEANLPEDEEDAKKA
ncbi:YtxH-like protein [compost metagenome]